jgi:predicted deacylase
MPRFANPPGAARPLPSARSRQTLFVRSCTLCLALLAITSFHGTSAEERWGAVEVIGNTIEPGSSSRFLFIQEQTYQASFLNAPVFVARGYAPGPTLCLTAGIHGDELNGVEVARRAFAETDAARLKGTLIAIPAINAEGVRTGNRYLSDRRDLNRAFPGNEGGSVAALIAHVVSREVLSLCNFLVDLHTGSDQRGNLPQVRADLDNQAIRELAIHFGKGLLLDDKGPAGSLRREVAKSGIPAILYEAGEPDRFQEDEIAHGMEGVFNVMAYLDMIDSPKNMIPENRVFRKSRWIRAGVEQSGFFFPLTRLGDSVKVGDVLGRVIDPFTNAAHEITAPIAGEVIGMAVSRPVLSGYGLFHIAWNSQSMDLHRKGNQ